MKCDYSGYPCFFFVHDRCHILKGKFIVSPEIEDSGMKIGFEWFPVRKSTSARVRVIMPFICRVLAGFACFSSYYLG